MKKKVLSLSLIAMIGLGAISTPSCKKYEEGPGISLLSKTARLAGSWKVEKYVDSDGTVETVDEDFEMEFDKDGTFMFISTDPSFAFSIPGTWEFSDDKTELTTQFTFLGTTETETQEIILLKNTEFAIKDSDGDKTYYVSID